MRLVVLISGSGSNLQAILDACAAGSLPAQVVAVVSNRRDAFGLTRAARAGVPQAVFPLGPYKRDGSGRLAYDADLADLINGYAPDLVVLAGWMHILSSAFLDRVRARVINLHPALPGAFPGTHAIERALEAWKAGEIAHTGVMVHEVIPEIDAGPVLGTAVVPIHNDDLDALEARIHATEHRLLVDVIRRLAAESS
ncbi:MAG: phosphoribosylglycinamide formyltransferase [Alphaproteobacteria bacterium]|nr:phosphoribosylglycinamide formyltransferase [Alphaproteobacteria bacterium]